MHMDESGIASLRRMSQILDEAGKCSREQALVAELSKYKALLDQIDQRGKEVEQTKAMIEKVKSYMREDNEAIQTWNKLLRVLENTIAELAQKRIALEAVLGLVADDKKRAILYLRYVKGYTWEKTAEMLFIDDRWCRRLHKMAIAELANKL